MAHASYRLFDGYMGTQQRDLAPLEDFISTPEAVANSPTRFMTAMTLGQVARSCRVMRLMGLDPNVWGEPGQVSLIGDHSVIPIVDGEPLYQGAPDENPDWRVAILVDAGDHLGAYAATMIQLEVGNYN